MTTAIYGKIGVREFQKNRKLGQRPKAETSSAHVRNSEKIKWGREMRLQRLERPGSLLEKRSVWSSVPNVKGSHWRLSPIKVYVCVSVLVGIIYIQ